MLIFILLRQLLFLKRHWHKKIHPCEIHWLDLGIHHLKYERHEKNLVKQPAEKHDRPHLVFDLLLR